MFFWRPRQPNPSGSGPSAKGACSPIEQELAAIAPKPPAPVQAARDAQHLVRTLEENHAAAARLLQECRVAKISKLQPHVLQSLDGLAQFSSLALEIVRPSAQEGSYRAFRVLDAGVDDIQGALCDLRLPNQFVRFSYVSSPRAQQLLSRGADIQDAISSACGRYIQSVRSGLLDSFFSFEHLIEPERLPQSLVESVSQRDKVKSATADVVLKSPLLYELPEIPAIHRLTGQAVIGFELLGDLADRLQFAPGGDLKGRLSAAREEFSECICVARSCFEELRAQLAAGLSKEQKVKFYRIIAPLETLLESGHQRFVTVWYQAQTPL